MIAACLALALAAPALARAEVWREVRGAHFTVVSDAEEEDARRIAGQFEVVRSLVGSVSGLRRDPKLPVTILAVRDEAGLRWLLPRHFTGKGHTGVAGFFFRGLGSHYIALRANASGPKPYSVLCHEYVHLLAESNFRRLPLWLDEGLTGFYAETEADEREVRWGRLSERHLEALRRGKWIPLDALLAATRESRYYTEAKWASTFHAESTALTHYLLLGPEPARRNFEELRRSLEQAEGGEGSPTEAFGDLGRLQQALESYVRGNRFSSRTGPIPEEASADLRVRELSPAEALAVRGQLLVESGHPVESWPVLARCLALNPGLIPARVALGRAHMRMGRRDESSRILGETLRMAPDNALVQYWSAVAMPDYGEGHSFALKEERLRRAIELGPEFAPAYRSLAQVYREQGVKLDEGISLARRACDLEPHSFEARLTLAGILRKAGHSSPAAEVEGEIRSLARADSSRLFSAALFFDRTGRPDAAEALLREAKARRPKDVTALAALGGWLYENQRYDEAEAVYREALALDPDMPRVLNNLGYMNVLRGVRLKEALDLIRRAVARRPLETGYLDSLGWALFRLGRSREAEATLREAVAHAEQPELLDHLADVLKARGALGEALGCWRRALAGGSADEELRQTLERKIGAAEEELGHRR